MGLITALLYLKILRVSRVRWIPLVPVFTLVTAEVYSLMSASTTVTTISMTLTSAVVTRALAISPLPAVYVDSASSLIFLLPVQVMTLNSADAFALLSIRTYIIACPTLFVEVDLVRSDLSANGGSRARAVVGAYLPDICTFWSRVALLACWVE